MVQCQLLTEKNVSLNSQLYIAKNSMHKVDIRDIFYINSSTGNIGGQEDSDLSRFDVFQCLLPVALFATTVNALAIYTLQAQIARDVVNSGFLHKEDYHLIFRSHVSDEVVHLKDKRNHQHVLQRMV